MQRQYLQHAHKTTPDEGGETASPQTGKNPQIYPDDFALCRNSGRNRRIDKAFEGACHTDTYGGYITLEIVISLIPFILGVLVLCSGCSKLQDAIDLKRLGYGSWLGLLIVAAINIILGVVLIYNPFKAAILLFRVLGVVLILSGAGDCFSTIYFARKLRRFKQEQDALDSTFEEVDPKDQN